MFDEPKTVLLMYLKKIAQVRVLLSDGSLLHSVDFSTYRKANLVSENTRDLVLSESHVKWSVANWSVLRIKLTLCSHGSII